ncbi:MAG: hypothetical protein IT222_12740 [Crocinitomix sp.]|nr:hypothetical protein [Crocinitomix sp.]
MKNLILLLFIIPVAVISCKKKGCTDELANNYLEDAKTDDGSCAYNWDKFLGTYNVTTGACNFPPDNHVSTISKGPIKDQIIISNFYDYGVNLKAMIVGNEFTFSETQGVGGYIGSGYIIDGSITINFFACESDDYPDNCTEVNCSVTYTK